jgi:predicted nucleic acid-binding protein
VAPGNHYELRLLERAAANDPIAVAAPTVMEISHGLNKAGLRDDRFLAASSWFTRLMTSDMVVVHALDAHAALVAGKLRARHPLPPTSRSRSRKGTKPDQRAAWILDIQIAACAWTAGAWLRTDNHHDFQVLSGLLSELYPNAAALQIEPGIGSAP